MRKYNSLDVLQENHISNKKIKESLGKISFGKLYGCKIISERERHLEKFRSEIFYGSKIISSKTDWTKNFHKKFFGRKIIYPCKIVSSKQGEVEGDRHTWENFRRKFFMLPNSFSKKTTCTKNLLVENFFMVAKSFPR